MANGKKVSLHDIAERIPCSASTVSLVLKGKGTQYRISGETQEKIRQTARELGYFSKQDTLIADEEDTFITIAVFLGLIDSNPINDMLKGISEYPVHKGKRIEYSIHPYLPKRLCDYKPLLTGNKYDGVIITAVSQEDRDFISSFDIKMPCVVMSAQIPGLNHVTADRIACGALVADLFIRKGHKNVGVVTRNTLTNSGRLKTFGFTSTYEEAAIPGAKITVIEDHTDGDYGLASMNELLEKTRNDPPTAIFVTEPNNFSGTINSLRNHNIKVPDDLDLVIFGSYTDNSISMCISPSITTIAYPIDKMMYDSVELICHQLDGGVLHGVSKVHSSQFVFRESCLPPENWGR